MAVYPAKGTGPIFYAFKFMVSESSPAYSCKHVLLIYLIHLLSGRAVFASCPHELTCTESETITLPANGGNNVSFNATVIYTGGGSCGYLQNISFIELRKTNETAGTSTTLYLCDFEAGPCSPRIGDVIFSRGSSRLEFVLTLFNVTTNDIGTYEVIVGTLHPGYSFREQLRKKFPIGK